MDTVEFGSDGLPKWERIDPPLWWANAGRRVVADRHLPDGTRQHMVKGSMASGAIISNAHVLGEDDVPEAEFSSRRSPLSVYSGGFCN